MRRLFAATLVLISVAGCSDYDQARRAYEGGDVKAALVKLEALAVGGDARAQYDISQMYFQGIGTTKDSQKGWFWLLSAAGAGNVGAMVKLGAIHESGVGADADLAAAAQWYLRAAKLGDGVGRFNLALMYVKGLGVPRDEVAALAWFTLALRSGATPARDHIDELERKLSAAEVSRAAALAKELAGATGH